MFFIHPDINCPCRSLLLRPTLCPGGRYIASAHYTSLDVRAIRTSVTAPTSLRTIIRLSLSCQRKSFTVDQCRQSMRCPYLVDQPHSLIGPARPFLICYQVSVKATLQRKITLADTGVDGEMPLEILNHSRVPRRTSGEAQTTRKRPRTQKMRRAFHLRTKSLPPEVHRHDYVGIVFVARRADHTGTRRRLQI